MVEFLKNAFERDTKYKGLWEQQNIELDQQKLINHRQRRKIKQLEIKIEKLEKEISDLKARRASKKSK